MEISILLLKQIASLVIMGLAGYWLRRMNFIDQNGSKGISAVGVYICIPCTFFISFQTSIDPEKALGFVYALIAVLLIHLLFFAGTGCLNKVYPIDGIEVTSIIYGNCGNLIIPLVVGIFGVEYVFYTSAFMFVANVLIWSHAVTRIQGGKIVWKKILMHPCMLGMLAGILFLLVGATLPDAAYIALNGMANCIGPLAMILIGVLIAETDMGAILKNRRIYIVTLFRLIVLPLLAIVGAGAVFYLFPYSIDPIVYYIVVLGASAPSATILTQMAQMADLDSGYASSISILTTLASIVTMPLMLAVAQLII